MNFLNRSVRIRIVALVALPLAALIVLYIILAAARVKQSYFLSQVKGEQDDVARPVAAAMSQIQTERHLTQIWLGSQGTAIPAAQMKAQRAKTDKALRDAKASTESKKAERRQDSIERQKLDDFYQQGANLPQLRAEIDGLAISRPEALDAYSKMTSPVLAAYDAETVRIPDATLNKTGHALVKYVQSMEMLRREDAMLSGALISGRFTTQDRSDFVLLVGSRRRTWEETSNQLVSSTHNEMERISNSPEYQSLVDMENEIISSTSSSEKPPFSLAQWSPATIKVLQSMAPTANTVANQVKNRASQLSDSVFQSLLVVGGLGLLVVIAASAGSVLLGRRLARQLADLRNLATTTADRDLPMVVDRLQRGEDVDVAREVPPRSYHTDEIGEVERAFDFMRRTAIGSTVDQAKLRRGVSEVFRNLAQRNQSLLHRQLNLLDNMERRATEPDALEDLFRLDHLTTRMRRHAEGLIILSGASPGRGWRKPVRFVDVLRGAVAEVEDYTRVTVLTPSTASLAGPAVADVLHLIAELVENATVFSPPNTPVHVRGDLVGTGFAIEVEDRGLGISEQHRAAINARLADPPEFDLSDSDRLGLFVVGQLAARHNIRVSLNPSAYGGVTAIVLIPKELVAEDGQLPAGSGHRDGAEVGMLDAPVPPASRPALLGGTATNGTAHPTMAHPNIAHPDMAHPQPPHPGPVEERLPREPGFLPEPPPPAIPPQAPPPVAPPAAPVGQQAPPPVYAPQPPVAAGPPPVLEPDPESLPAGPWRDWWQPPTAAESNPPPWAADWPANGEVVEDMYEGLPRRIRQANLAPQLAEEDLRNRRDEGAPLAERSPEEARSLVTAFRFGWRQGSAGGLTAPGVTDDVAQEGDEE
ncbi:MAG: nitrate- and nitrite sensing domain-containing protein [Mycobacteriales bacterium]